MNRRQIIRKSAMAGAAAVLPVAAGVASAAHRPVVSALGTYSDRVETREEGGKVHIVASLDRIEKFCDVETRAHAFPYAHVRADGNVLFFTHRGIDYRVENVLAENFEARARSLA